MIAADKLKELAQAIHNQMSIITGGSSGVSVIVHPPTRVEVTARVPDPHAHPATPYYAGMFCIEWNAEREQWDIVTPDGKVPALLHWFEYMYITQDGARK